MDVDHSITLFDHAFLNAMGISLQDIGYAVSIDRPTAFDKKLSRPFRNDFLIIMIITKGKLNIRINLLDQTITKGQLLLIMPHTIFEMTGASEDLEINNLLVDREFFGASGLHVNSKEAIEFISADHNKLSLSQEECNIFNCLLQVMRYQGAQEDSVLLRKDITRHIFLSFMFELTALYRKYNVSKNPNVSRKEELTLRFVQLVSTHFREQRGVQFYADQLYVTAKYLSMAIKEVTTKSPGAVIDEAVVAEAKILLTNPSSSVAEIAEVLNFSDQSFFGKYFKKHSGYSPSDYRQQYWSL